MKIISVKLNGYSYLSLNQISQLTYVPKHKLQLILGTNGSGKSSLLRELSPLPAEHSQYKKEGSKEVVIEHKNSHYILSSIFNTAGKHYIFNKDGIDLNAGGTATTYRELVKREFGITPDIHGLMIGTVRFHQMSVAERRNWFTRISQSDYTYALRFYGRIKEQLRDFQGALKVAQSKLLKETEKLLPKEMVSQCKEEIIALRELLSKLLEFKQPISIQKHEATRTLLEMEQQLQSHSNTIRGLTRRLRDLSFTDGVTVEHDLMTYQGALCANKQLLDYLYGEICDKRNLKYEIVKSTQDPSRPISKQLETAYKERVDIRESIYYPNVRFNDYKLAHETINYIWSDLVALIKQQLEYSFYSDLSKNEIEEFLSTYKSDQLLLADTTAKLDNLINRDKLLTEQYEHNMSECPNCQHKWSRNYDSHKHQSLKDEILQLTAIIQDLSNKISTNSSKAEAISQLHQLRSSTRELMAQHKILYPLWEHLKDLDLLDRIHQSIVTVVSRVKGDLTKHMTLDELDLKIDQLKQVKDTSDAFQNVSVITIEQEIAALDQRIGAVVEERNYNQRAVDNLIKTTSILKDVKTTKQILDTLLSKHDGVYNQLTNTLKQEAVNEQIQIVQLALTYKERAITMSQQQQDIVDSLSTDIRVLEGQISLLKIAEQRLSPTEGLIAEGLTGFINHFIQEVNSVIKRIWTYPLELLPIAVTGEDELDLDYKFPIRVNDYHTAPDISKGSGAMREIVDLAFRIVSMKYLGLQDYPLYFDEFGNSFDMTHREAAFRAVSELIDSDMFSQVFMISHYEQSYGSFKNADFNVMCSHNLSLPKEAVFNRCLSLT